MLRSLNDIHGYKVLSLDGPLGTVHEFYFDDEAWTIRYMVVDLGTWLPGRKVLISPEALSQPDWESNLFPLKLTKDEIENSPDIDTDKPVSYQHESELMAYYNWTDYRAIGSTILPTGIAVPVATVPEPAEPPEPVSEEVLEKVATGHNETDNHLRSSKSVIGYDIQARDGKIGHVEDFIVDDQTWMINYMIVDTRNWLPGKKVIISPHWVEAVHWAISEVKVDLLKQTIENSPEYDPSAPINQDYEDKLYDYYGRPKN